MRCLSLAVVAFAITVSWPIMSYSTAPFGDYPDWKSDDARKTNDVTLADFNGDGWLEVTAETIKPDGVSKVFYVNHFPALTVDAVWVDGVPLPRADYCFDARAGWISLKDTPPISSVIEVDYVWSDKLDLYAANGPLGQTTYSYDDTGDTILARDRPTSDAVVEEDLRWLGSLVLHTGSESPGPLGVTGGSDVIYFNNGEGLNTEPGWYAQDDEMFSSYCFTCIAADFDNDGDVDAAIAGDDDIDHIGGEFIRLFENDGAGLKQEPIWAFEGPDNLGWARRLCWGDVDNDDYLELAAADTWYEDRFYVFKNTGGVLENEPSWLISGYNFAYDVAWGDMDGDGDMDLAASTNHNGAYGDGFAYVFKNNDGVLDTEPCWKNDPPFGKCKDVEWADVNRDGALDLLKGISGCAGSDPYTDIHFSEGRTIPTYPTWESELYMHAKWSGFADCNADGYLDLLHGGSAYGYLSNSGSLETYPSWCFYQGYSIKGIAIGDINRDGFPDLAFGADAKVDGEGFSNLVFYNTVNTGIKVNGFAAAYKGDSVILTWETESNDIGFNLYRAEKPAESEYRSTKSRISVPGETKINVDLIRGRSPYTYVDANVEPNATYYYWLEAIDNAGHTERFGPVECTWNDVLPTAYALYQSRPNPAKGSAVIAFDLPEVAEVTLAVYDVSGRKVKTLADETLTAGTHERSVAGLPPGVYVYKLVAGAFNAARNMVIVE
jgi:hypothetical protein